MALPPGTNCRFLPTSRPLMVMLTGFLLLSCGEEELFEPGHIYTGTNHLEPLEAK